MEMSGTLDKDLGQQRSRLGRLVPATQRSAPSRKIDLFLVSCA